MKTNIPNNTLSNSQISKYGSGGLELVVGEGHAGCPKLYKATYIDKVTPEPISYPLSYGIVMHEALYLLEKEELTPEEALKKAWDPQLKQTDFSEALDDLRNVIERGGVLPNLHTVAVEQPLKRQLYIDEDFGPIFYRGILDWVGIGEEEDVLYFADYKTDRAPWSQQDAQNWVQGKSYAWLLQESKFLQQELPGITRPIIVGLVELTKFYTLHVNYTEEEIEAWRSWAEATARKILRDTEFKPKLNKTCNWCTIKNDCEAWLGLPEHGNTLLEKFNNTPLEKRIHLIDEAKETKKKLDNLIKTTESEVYEKIATEGAQNIGGNHYNLESSLSSKIVDLPKIHELMGDKFYDLAGFTITNLKKWAKEENMSIDEFIIQIESNPRLKKKPLN